MNLYSLAASTIMRVTYGIEIMESNDIYIEAAERAGRGGAKEE